MMSLFRQYWFLIALASAFALGFGCNTFFAAWADSAELRNAILFVCMFLMALPLEAKAILETLRYPQAVLLSIFITFGLLPLVAWGISPLLAEQYVGGFLVAAVTPCTMASATVWTRKAGGNDTVATIVTVISNVICFVVTPAWLYVLTGNSNTQALGNFWNTVYSLTLTVVLPVALAQGLRYFSLIAIFANKRKSFLSLLSQLCILFMVLLGAVKTSEKLDFSMNASQELVELITMIVVVLGLHVSMFWAGYYLARWLGFTRGDQIAIGFAGSQKTLMVGMTVSLANSFNVLPMVTYHIGQLFIDTLLADRLVKGNHAEKLDV
jgi:solute carrier family 10 (sodium/bile acid cotransporter), member 7